VAAVYGCGGDTLQQPGARIQKSEEKTRTNERLSSPSCSEGLLTAGGGRRQFFENFRNNLDGCSLRMIKSNLSKKLINSCHMAFSRVIVTKLCTREPKIILPGPVHLKQTIAGQIKVNYVKNINRSIQYTMYIEYSIGDNKSRKEVV
jgi:hypothetical protein